MPGRSQQLSSPHPHTPLSSSSMDAASASHTNYPSSLPLHYRRQLTSVEKFSHHLDNDMRDLGLDLLRSYSLQPLSEVDHTAAIHNSAHGRHHDLPRWPLYDFININSSNSTRRLLPRAVLQPRSLPLPLPLPVTFGSNRKPVFPAGANGGSGGDAYPLPSPDEGVNRGQNDKGRVWDREKGKTIEKERLKEDRNRDGTFSSPVDFFSGRSSTLQGPQSPGPRRNIDHTETRSSSNRSHGLNLTDRTEPNFGIQVPFSSAPPSNYSSPVLSPRRMSTGDIFSSFPYHMTQQLRSAPEMPPIDVHSSFPFTSFQDKALFGLDYSPIQSPQAPTPKRVRSSITRPASPGCPGSFSSTLMVHHENNGNAIDGHVWPRSKSRPTSPVQPRFMDTSMVHQENNVNVHSLPQSQSRSHPASPVRPRFPADILMAHQENNYPLLQSQSKSHPVSSVRPRFPAETSMVHHDQNKTVVHGHPLPIPPSDKTPAHSSPVCQITPRPELYKQWSKAKFIGRGTYGSVFEATNKETGAMCAMKEVELCPDDPMAVRCMKQLEQEIEVLSHLKHPNIVQYCGSEIVDDKFYIYLELVYPGSIKKYIRETALTESVVRNFTRHILSGLAYLHSTKTIHRDIKGANLLVDASGVVKLADFGMAKHLSEQAAELSLKGSPYWMAPELMQAVLHKDRSPDLALAVDIWSLGCTVIEMFTGRPPWHEYEGAAAMFKVLKESPPLPENLSEEGKDFLRCCFRRNPAERPSASQLLEHQFVMNSGYPVDVLGNTQSPFEYKSVTTSPSSRELWGRNCFI